MRRLICSALFITVASHVWGAQEVEDDGSYRMLVSAGVGRFTGDYGEAEKTTLDVLSLNARWYFDRAEVQISVPYLSIDGSADVTFVDGQPVTVGGDSDSDERRKESGVGDVVLRGEYYLRTGTQTSPWVIGLLRVKLPTGSEAKGLGSGATDVETGIGLIQKHGPISWLADVSYIFVGNADERDAKNEVRVGAGVSMPFGRNDRNSSYVYFENRTNRFDGPDRRSIAVGLSTSLGDAKRLRLSASTFFGLSDSSEDVGIYLTMGYRY
jgi:hypothetical protein